MMKKLLTILLAFAFTTNLSFAVYSPTSSETELFNQAKIKITNLYNKDINRAYSVKNNINKFFTKYEKSEI
jgi:hypothetical protein